LLGEQIGRQAGPRRPSGRLEGRQRRAASRHRDLAAIRRADEESLALGAQRRRGRHHRGRPFELTGAQVPDEALHRLARPPQPPSRPEDRGRSDEREGERTEAAWLDRHAGEHRTGRGSNQRRDLRGVGPPTARTDSAYLIRAT
jgi:hypothetical protein